MKIKYVINRVLGRTPKTQKEKNRSLAIAAYYGHTIMVKALLNVGAEVNKNEEKINNSNVFFTEPLYLAASKGHTETVKALLDNGAKVNLSSRYTHGNTALHIATLNGHTKTVAALLEKENPNSYNDGGETALQIATRNGNTEIRNIFDAHVKEKNNAASKSMKTFAVLSNLDKESKNTRKASDTHRQSTGRNRSLYGK